MLRTLFLCLIVISVGILVFSPTGYTKRLTNSAKSSESVRPLLTENAKFQKGGGLKISSAGLPSILSARSALSAAVITAVGGRGTQFSDINLLADWDGREDYGADRAQKIDDFSFAELEVDSTLTREAISEHTYANGFNENVFYYGDSVGNLWIGTDTNPGINLASNGAVDTLLQVNIPTLIRTGTSGGVSLLNPQAGDCTDDQVTVTGIAVGPVADLADFGSCDVIGEVVYVSVEDTGGCASNAAGQPFRTRILVFGFTDIAGGVSSAGAIQIVRNPLSNPGGIAVDDGGNLYFHLADKLNRQNGAAIFKVAETPRTVAACATNPRINRVVASVPSGLSGGIGVNTALGTAAAPIIISAGYRLTNYGGGASTTYGNIAALTAGPQNILYAAVARSLVSTDDPETRSTEGLYTNPVALGPTPSMIISFSDVSGAFDLCSAPFGSPPGSPGVLKIADGFGDVASAPLTRVAGVNNFRVFVQGNGPDIRDTLAGTALGATTTNTLPPIDMQIDYSIYSGITVNEDKTVFVVSGGTPAGLGVNPSPSRGEILAFSDSCPANRRADFIDLRGNNSPNPPASGGNVGDGDSDRFDHIYWQAPLDSVSEQPTGIAGLARGFLLYTNRTRLRNVGTLANLPNGTIQGDDSTNGPLLFEDFDAGHQVAGGDDQNTPFRGDDNDGLGDPVSVAALFGGFEFDFGGPASAGPWNAFYLNSNGNVTFSAGDTDNTPTVIELRSGLPKIAPAWFDLNPASRATNLTSFPVQALGFSNINSFKTRWIDVPEFGSEGCSTTAFGVGGNSVDLSLLDDGTGTDENANQPLNPANPIGNNAVPFDNQEGPTDLRFSLVANPGLSVLIADPLRANGTGQFTFDYGKMLALGTADRAVLTGYSAGTLLPTNPPGLCAINLGEAARASDLSPFGVIQSQTASILPCTVGEGTEPTIFQFFDMGTAGMLGPGGEVIPAVPAFDLRSEGNDPALTTPVGQSDPNRGTVTFYGLAKAPPPNPLGLAAVPVTPVLVAPNQPPVGSAAAGSQVNSAGQRIATPTSGIINALGDVGINYLGSGFFPNEVTTVCPNDSGTQRPGKTVTTAVVLNCDTNFDGAPDLAIPLGSVTPLNKNLVRGTLPSLDSMGLPGTAFPLQCLGGLATLNLTTTFTAGDNNIFGPFTRTSNITIDLGYRAPVVLSVNPTSGDASLPQVLTISGSGFIIPTSPTPITNVTTVFAVQIDNPANVVTATNFVILNEHTITATFNFGGANAGRQFLIFVSGPNGTSRNLLTAAGDAPAGNEQGNIITFNAEAPPANSVRFDSLNIDAVEGCTAVNVNITRLNPSGTATVDYDTVNVSATQKSDYTIASGTISFAAGETTKTIQVLISEDTFVEGTEQFNIVLSNPSAGANVGAPITITITDDDLVPPTTNAIDDAAVFVCQHYHDFLNREPDAAGLAFWVNEIASCGANAACIEVKRINVSAAFFLSIEFQETGFGVLRTQRVAFGRKSENSVTRYSYASFMRDAQQLGRGVVIGQPGAAALLEQNQQAYATQIVNSSAFTMNFPGALTAAQYVDALFMSAMVTPTTSERNAAITAFGAGGTAGRVTALRSVVDSQSVRSAEFNPSFVLMQYYGYLRRNPTDPPDADDTGYQFWLNKLNTFGGNFIQAELVKGFLSSTEYRQRFGPM